MDPPEQYDAKMGAPEGYDEAPQLVPEGGYVVEYPAAVCEQITSYLESAEKAFAVSFKSNEKTLKNPNQLVVDNTLHCMPNKLVCAYLGKRIGFLDGRALPRVYVYLRYKDDKDKNKKVTTCDKHRQNLQNPFSVLQSDNVDVMFHDIGTAYMLDFAYPQGEGAPSISFSFACSSSCFSRSVFELHFELVFLDIYHATNQGPVIFYDKYLVKVSANPARDSGCQQSAMVDKIKNFKNAFIPSSKARVRKYTDDKESGPSSKRSVSGSEQAQLEVMSERIQAEIPENGVYNLVIYGNNDYKKMLDHYNLLLTSDKYQLAKCAKTPAINNSQIPDTADLDAWLESNRMVKYKNLFNGNRIRTMNDLHKKYHCRLFEELKIPAEDAKSLHCSFIYWRTPHLQNIFQNAGDVYE